MNQNDLILINGHINGLISDGSEFPKDSVQECLNMDFYPTHDERRMPYSQVVDLSDYIEGTYEIIGFHQTRFTDLDGTSQEVMIFVTKDLQDISSRIRIYVDYYYNPDTSIYANRRGSVLLPEGWENKITELTELFDINIAGEVIDDPGSSYLRKYVKFNLASSGLEDVFQKEAEYENYFGGFFLYDYDGKCVGVVESSYNEDEDTVFIVALNSILDSGSIIDYPLADGLQDFLLKLQRFPRNLDISEDSSVEITEATFKSSLNGNAVQICLGTGMRILELSFLEDRQIVETDNYPDIYKSAWNGFWFSFDIPIISEKKTFLYSNNTPGGYSTYTNYIDSYGSIFNELGVIVKYITMTTTGAGKIRIGSILCSLNGFQAIFLKNLVLGKTQSSGYNYISFFFQTDYDRRITNLHFFWGQDESFEVNSSKLDAELFQSYQLMPDIGGNVNVRTNNGNIGIVGKNIYEVWLIQIGTSTQQPPYIWNGNSTYDLTNVANGLSLNSFLNNYYWKDIHINADKILQVLNYNIAINIDREKIDSETLVSGKQKISISNLQQGAVETSSIFPDERDRQISTNFEITAGLETISNQFLIFTEKYLYLYELLDGDNGTIAQRRIYGFAGTYSNKTLVKADILDQFAGLYYLSSDSIYRFLDSSPEDILFGKWKDAYRLIPEEDKRNAVTGYMSETKEVWFRINETVYIWNILYQHWKVYSIFDIPQYMISALSGQVYWSSGNIIYTLERKGTAYINDETSDATHNKIPFMYKKILSHGSKLKDKIPDRLALLFESEAVNDNDEFVEISVGRNGNVNDILDSHTINIVNDPNQPDDPTEYKYNLKYGKAGESIRARAKFYDIKLSYVDNPGLAGYLKNFKIKELLINAKI